MNISKLAIQAFDHAAKKRNSAIGAAAAQRGIIVARKYEEKDAVEVLANLATLEQAAAEADAECKLVIEAKTTIENQRATQAELTRAGAIIRLKIQSISGNVCPT